MIQVKQFREYGTSLETQINKFLKENSGIEVIDIKYAVNITNVWTSSALLIYKKAD